MSLRLLSRNTAIYAVGNVGARAAVFLLIPLYTHALSVADFGLLAALQVTVRIVGVLISGGMGTTLLRFSPEYERDGRLNRLLGTSLLIVVLAALAATGICLALCPWLFRQVLHAQDGIYPLMALTCGAALAQSLSTQIMSYYRARHQAVRFMLAGLSSAVLLFVATFILTHVVRLGVYGAMLAFIAAHTAVFLVVLAGLLWRPGLRISWPLAPQLARFGFPQACSQCSEMWMASISVYLLSYFAGLEAVAIYSLGYKLALILIITTISPFSLAFEPYIFSNRDKLEHRTLISRSLTYMVLAAVLASSCLLVLIRFLLPRIAPPEYGSAFLVILMLVPGIIFMGVYYYGQALLNAMNKARIVGTASLAVAVASVVLNAVLIRRFGWYGAVVAFDLSFIVLGCMLVAFGVRHFSVALEWRRILALGLLLLALLVYLAMLRGLPAIRFAVVSVLALVLSILLLLHYGFFHADEKLLARRLAGRWC